jgi:hypothetical protein
MTNEVIECGFKIWNTMDGYFYDCIKGDEHREHVYMKRRALAPYVPCDYRIEVYTDTTCAVSVASCYLTTGHTEQHRVMVHGR